ncbi:MAG: hypothetical protein ABIU95_14800 [Burkholderiales bacterium]
MPVTMFGAAMGLCGLALVTRAAHDVLAVPAWLGELWAWIGIVVYAILLGGYLRKLVEHPDAVRAELANPATLGFFGTITIATALAAGCLGPYAPDAARVLWWIGAIGMIVVQVYAMSRWLAGGIELGQVNTGWMIAFIGPVPVAVPGLLSGELEAARVLFGLSAMATPLIVGLVLHRTILGPPMPDAIKPTTFILLVPVALIYAYAPRLWGVAPGAFLDSLFLFDLVMTAALLLYARRAFRWPFGPAWWAFTFPLDAVAVAGLAFAQFHPTPIGLAIAWALWGLATVVVLVVLVRTLLSFTRGTLFVAPKAA